MKKPIVEEVFADNGEHSHWKLIDSATGETLWEQPDDSQNSGKPLVSGSLPPAPTDDEIEANGIEGGLRGAELQLYWEGAVWMRSKAKWRQ